MGDLAFPLLLVVFASFFQGTFGLGMKYMRPLAWEGWWLVHVTVAMVVLPWLWALVAVPDLAGAIWGAPRGAVVGGMLYGFLWGVGGILFGVSVGRVGVSITYGIVMGLAASMGSLVPLFQMGGAASRPAFPWVIMGVVVMLVGVAISAVAGVLRDRLSAADGDIGGIRTGSAFRVGLGIAVASGVLSALLNVGFASAQPVAKAAEALGAVTRNSSLAAWVVVLVGAYAMNAGYALLMLAKNRSWGSFGAVGSAKAYRWAVLAGLFWFGALGVYGQGAALMGEMGPVIGWPMLLGLALVISNVWASRAGEWKGAPGPFRLMLAGVGVLIVACVILGYANGIK
ncbi:MAG: rhamnose/proton symporter RhaT [Verrucomicrobiae bacterium]|nr:rhamnose/proton symporter RhaT [Verrucomicrobiae bacterium]